MALNTPILFLIFNRPDTTQLVFNEIRKVKPTKLYVAADGPRKDKEGEAERCRQTREIVKQVDWKCELKTLFRENNLGCGVAPATAISWLFENEEEGIILEDDCLPSSSFFIFCEKMLHFYKNNRKIMLISGNNYQFGRLRGNGSYYFSRIAHTWGWATWKRSWEKYDFNMETYRSFKKNKKIKKIFSDARMQEYWLKHFDMVVDGTRKDIWDYQWFYSIMNENGFCITPNVNLVTNIGHLNDATHTKGKTIISDLKHGNLYNLIHPKDVLVNIEADKYFFYRVLQPTVLYIFINMLLIAKNYVSKSYWRNK